MLIYNYVLNDEAAAIIIIPNFEHLSYLFHNYQDSLDMNKCEMCLSC